jgi:hypothetical protein
LLSNHEDLLEGMISSLNLIPLVFVLGRGGSLGILPF